jgi:hypothetical protein
MDSLRQVLFEFLPLEGVSLIVVTPYILVFFTRRVLR